MLALAGWWLGLLRPSPNSWIRLLMELPTHSSLSYHGNSGEVGCYVASRPLTKDSNYFEVGRAGGEIIKLQGVF